MREIKFRAWDKKYNFMLEPEAFNRNDIWISGDGSVYEIEEWSSYSGGGKCETNCSEQYIFMQYTGLQDRNGKDIYEGDIVSFKDNLESVDIPLPERVGRVGFLNASFRIERPAMNHYRWMDYDCEVIGNIYEGGQGVMDTKECLDCIHAFSNDNDELVCTVEEKHVIVADDYRCDKDKEVSHD